MEKDVITENIEDTGRDRFHEFWKSIWSCPKSYETNADWIPIIEKELSEITTEQELLFTSEDISKTPKQAANRKSPGPDKLHNPWLKYLTATHEHLALRFAEALNNPNENPKYLMEGNTYPIFKKGEKTNPENYSRPITCLSNAHKLFTSPVTKKNI